MINESRLGRYAFFVIALVVGVFLAARPIPGTDDPNDTGRFIEILRKPPVFDGDLRNLKDLSVALYGIVFSPFSEGGLVRIFLFFHTMLISLAFLTKKKRGEGAFIFSLAFLCSFYFLELSTNALRQSVGVFFLLKAYDNDDSVLKLPLLLISCFFHYSSLLFLPLFFCYDFTRQRVRGTNLLFTIIAAAFVVTFALRNIQLLRFFLKMYSEGNSPLFLAYLLLPILTLSFFLLERDGNIRAVIVYSTAIEAIFVLLFPAITFRIVFSEAALILYIMLERRVASAIPFIIFMLHNAIYIFVSDNYIKTQLVSYF